MLPNPLISFKLGNIPIEVYMYGVMIAVGILALFFVLFKYSKKLGVNPAFTDFVYYNAIVSIALGFGSAAVFQGLYDYIENPENGFSLDSGITFIGGLIGGVATFLIIYAIFRKKLKGRLVDSLSIIPCCILIGHGFGRVGCFFAGCCYGLPTDSVFGVLFPGHTTPVHPTQLYEAAFLFLMFGICSFLLLKYGFKHNMSLYLVTYGIFRFLIEFVRNDDRGELVAGISPSQFWSILMIVAGIGLFFLMKHVLLPRREAELAKEAAASSAVADADASEPTADAPEAVTEAVNNVEEKEEKEEKEKEEE